MYDSNDEELIEIANMALTKEEREQWKRGALSLYMNNDGDIVIYQQDASASRELG